MMVSIFNVQRGIKIDNKNTKTSNKHCPKEEIKLVNKY